MAIEARQAAEPHLRHQALTSHRALAAILGVILRLPPARRLMAGEQMKSRYLAALFERMAP